MVLRKRVEEQAILLRESESRFRHMALHDALTGLATRILLEDRLDTAVEAAKRHQTGMALLMIDIDKFKTINDTYGHHSGDEVLRVAADRLMQAVRKSDTVARMGGDEFVVLLPDIHDPAHGREHRRENCKIASGAGVFMDFQIPVSASVGVCTLDSDGLDVEMLLKSADEALYKPRRAGEIAITSSCRTQIGLDLSISKVEHRLTLLLFGRQNQQLQQGIYFIGIESWVPHPRRPEPGQTHLDWKQSF